MTGQSDAANFGKAGLVSQGILMPQYPGFDIATFTAHFGNDNGRAWSNTFYWAAASTNLSESNSLAGVTAFHQQLGAVVKNIMHDSCFLRYSTVRIFISGGLVENTYAESIQGTLNGQEAMPLETALIVDKKTSTFGRSAAGRYFFSGLGEDMQQNGQIIDTTAVTNAKALASFLGADRTFSVLFHARHWDRKNNIFLAIKSCHAKGILKTRKDRTAFTNNPSL